MKILIGWALLFAFWWILAGMSRPIIFGLGMVLAAAVIGMYRRFELSIDLSLSSLKHPLLWLKFLFSLIAQICISTMRTCYFILTDKTEPKIVAYETDLQTGYGLLFLLNSITLTPTTIAILSEGNLVYIHHLHIKDQVDYEKMSSSIRSHFEKPLKKLVG